MNSALGFSRTIFGLGVGMFAVGYLFQVPSQAACVYLGPRRWLAAILAAWGVLAMCCAAIRGVASFLLLRLALGVAEAGAFPAMMYQLGLFYDAKRVGEAYTWCAGRRGTSVARAGRRAARHRYLPTVRRGTSQQYHPAFPAPSCPRVTTATAVAGLLGGPLAAGLMSLDGLLGLAGWRLLFLAEGLLPLLLAGLLPLALPTSPLTTGFLTPAERDWLWQSVHGGGEIELCGPAAGASQRQQQQQQGQQALSSGSGGGAEHEHEVSPEAVAAIKPQPDAGLVEGEEEEGTSALEVPLSAPAPGAASVVAGGGAGEAGGLRSALHLGVLDPRIWYLSGGMFCIEWGMTSVHAWVPQIVASLLRGGLDADDEDEGGAPSLRMVVAASLLASIPFFSACIAMVGNAAHSRRSNERRWHSGLPLLAAGVAFLALPLLARVGEVAALTGLSLAAAGIWATHGPFFSWPATILEHNKAAAAIGFAAVKTGGSVGSFLGPLAIGLLADGSPGFGGAMLLMAAVCAAGGCLALAFRGGSGSGSSGKGYQQVEQLGAAGR